jgi:hypothetical protein
VLTLSDLPPSTQITSGLAETAVDQIPMTAAAKELWTRGRALITLDLIAPLTCAPPITIADDGIAKDDSIVQIFFRQGAPARMRVFIADQTADPAKSTLRSIADRFDNFIHPCLPVAMMTFKRSAWADRAS